MYLLELTRKIYFSPLPKYYMTPPKQKRSDCSCFKLSRLIHIFAEIGTIQCVTWRVSYLVYRLLTASLQSTRNFSITLIVCGMVKSVSSPKACRKVCFYFSSLKSIKFLSTLHTMDWIWNVIGCYFWKH